jgi:hypothetical protein
MPKVIYDLTLVRQNLIGTSGGYLTKYRITPRSQPMKLLSARLCNVKSMQCCAAESVLTSRHSFAFSQTHEELTRSFGKHFGVFLGDVFMQRVWQFHKHLGAIGMGE